MGYMCTSAHYLNNIPLVVFTDTLANIQVIGNYNNRHKL